MSKAYKILNKEDAAAAKMFIDLSFLTPLENDIKELDQFIMGEMSPDPAEANAELDNIVTAYRNKRVAYIKTWMAVYDGSKRQNVKNVLLACPHRILKKVMFYLSEDSWGGDFSKRSRLNKMRDSLNSLVDWFTQLTVAIEDLKKRRQLPPGAENIDPSSFSQTHRYSGFESQVAPGQVETAGPRQKPRADYVRILTDESKQIQTRAVAFFQDVGDVYTDVLRGESLFLAWKPMADSEEKLVNWETGQSVVPLINKEIRPEQQAFLLHHLQRLNTIQQDWNTLNEGTWRVYESNLVKGGDRVMLDKEGKNSYEYKQFTSGYSAILDELQPLVLSINALVARKITLPNRQFMTSVGQIKVWYKQLHDKIGKLYEFAAQKYQSAVAKSLTGFRVPNSVKAAINANTILQGLTTHFTQAFDNKKANISNMRQVLKDLQTFADSFPKPRNASLQQAANDLNIAIDEIRERYQRQKEDNEGYVVLHFVDNKWEPVLNSVAKVVSRFNSF